MHPTDRPEPRQPALRRLVASAGRNAGLLVVGLVIGALLAPMIRDYALLGVVLLPVVLWTLANRSALAATGGRGFDLSRAPTADLVAMTIGVLLAVPAAAAAVDGPPWRAALLVVVVAVLGFGVLGYADAIAQGAVLGPVAGLRSARAVRFVDASLRGLRTSSGLTNLYLAAVGTWLAFPRASDWWPVAAVAVTAVLHSVLDGRRHAPIASVTP